MVKYILIVALLLAVTATAGCSLLQSKADAGMTGYFESEDRTTGIQLDSDGTVTAVSTEDGDYGVYGTYEVKGKEIRMHFDSEYVDGAKQPLDEPWDGVLAIVDKDTVEMNDGMRLYRHDLSATKAPTQSKPTAKASPTKKPAPTSAVSATNVVGNFVSVDEKNAVLLQSDGTVVAGITDGESSYYVSGTYEVGGKQVLMHFDMEYIDSTTDPQPLDEPWDGVLTIIDQDTMKMSDDTLLHRQDE